MFRIYETSALDDDSPHVHLTISHVYEIRQAFFAEFFWAFSLSVANACVVPPLPRRVRQENVHATTDTIMAGMYAKITERGSGQYQRFVSSYFDAFTTVSFILFHSFIEEI